MGWVSVFAVRLMLCGRSRTTRRRGRSGSSTMRCDRRGGGGAVGGGVASTTDVSKLAKVQSLDIIRVFSLADWDGVQMMPSFRPFLEPPSVDISLSGVRGGMFSVRRVSLQIITSDACCRRWRTVRIDVGSARSSGGSNTKEVRYIHGRMRSDGHEQGRVTFTGLTLQFM